MVHEGQVSRPSWDRGPVLLCTIFVVEEYEKRVHTPIPTLAHKLKPG